MMKRFFNQIGAMIVDFFRFWSKPKEGRYLSNKEAFCFCIGGMGPYAASVIPTYVTLAAGAYIAVAYGFTVAHITLAGIIVSIVNIIKTPIYSMMLDNIRTKKGKFRPYLLWMPIPIILSFIALAWLPYSLPTYMAQYITFLIIFNVLMFFMGLYSSAFNGIVQVISPSPEERTQLMSIGAFIYSLGPSIVHILIPALAGAFFGSAGLNDIRTFQYLVPIMCAIFLAQGLLVYFGTKERAVISKQYKQKVGFIAGFKKVIKNKYFLISTASAMFGLLKLSMITTPWICLYMVQSSSFLGLVNTIIGTASIPGMLLAPILIKKFGKRNLVIFSHIASMVVAIPMLFFLNNAAILIICCYLVTLFTGITVVTGPAINSMIYDYQQYKTGDRLEGFLGNIGGLATTILSMGTALIMPAIYAFYGYIDNSDLLYDSLTRNPIFRWGIIIAIISSVLGAIPMLFFNLTEKKHGKIMEVLKIRADHEDGLITDEEAKSQEEAISI